MGLRYRTYLAEAILNMNRDVDWLYKASGFDKLNGVLVSENTDRIRSAFKPIMQHRGLRTDSSKLKSRVGKRAHKQNPVKINIVIGTGSYYNPGEREIRVAIHSDALDLVFRALIQPNPSQYLKNMLGKQYPRFIREFDASNVKGTIAHELTHWASDSIRNWNVSKTLERVKEKTAKGMMVRRGDDPTVGGYQSMTQHPLELDAQVQAVEQIRRSLGKRKFDKLTWKDLFMEKSSLMFNLSTNTGLSDKEYMDVLKRFVKRLNREGLLGKGLRKLPTQQFISYVRTQL